MSIVFGELQVFDDIEQGTPEWFEARLGIPTASEFKAVCAKPGPRGGIPKTRQTYLRKLAGERLTGEPMTTYSNENMERGHLLEGEAADMYALLRDADPVRVGFMRNDLCGCSPDRLLGDDGLLEIKTAAPHIQIERLEAGVLPPEHVAQCQGQLMVSGRRWLDFMSYWPKMPPLIVRVERDEDYIAELRVDVAEFANEIHELVEKIRGM